MKPKFIEPHAFRERVLTFIEGDSMTHESFKEECDINAIVGRYARTGELPADTRAGAYADVTALQGDLTQRISESRETFKKVKAAERAQQERQQLDLETEIRKRVEQELNAARQGGNAPAAVPAPVSQGSAVPGPTSVS